MQIDTIGGGLGCQTFGACRGIPPVFLQRVNKWLWLVEDRKVSIFESLEAVGSEGVADSRKCGMNGN